MQLISNKILIYAKIKYRMHLFIYILLLVCNNANLNL